MNVPPFMSAALLFALLWYVLILGSVLKVRCISWNPSRWDTPMLLVGLGKKQDELRGTIKVIPTAPIRGTGLPEAHDHEDR